MACKFTRNDLALAAGVVFVFLWLALVWPTPWKEYKTGNYNLRVNRFTGATQTLGETGWYSDSSSAYGELRVSDLLNTPAAWGGAGAVLGGVGLLGWLLARRRIEATHQNEGESPRSKKRGPI